MIRLLYGRCAMAFDEIVGLWTFGALQLPEDNKGTSLIEGKCDDSKPDEDMVESFKEPNKDHKDNSDETDNSEEVIIITNKDIV
ncbi:hypothetical protein L1987_49096 [Smallanthus sonchifolius]|uniref:Uncharacterized protein n=1 Tax=Smallanthus sonchifolius TaxID=185202 RepID=A0ACB9FUE6_9ASTR|nr:hypothetical protein L1987_49096 [Smallanthus sonchifolius]